jgi:hypothetical protein
MFLDKGQLYYHILKRDKLRNILQQAPADTLSALQTSTKQEKTPTAKLS